MITTDIINETYIKRVVAKHSKTIFDTQESVVNSYLEKRSGDLADSIAQRKFTVDGTRFTFPLLNYLRFLDIKYRKQMTSERRNLALYNRVVWGVLYQEMLPALRYGLTQEIKKEIHDELLQNQLTQ